MTHVEPVDIVAMDDARERRTNMALNANEWLSTAAQATFGTDTEVISSSVKAVGDKQRVSAETNRGSIAGWWPESTSNPRRPKTMSAFHLGVDLAR
ncbi:hypothetical protein AB0F46_26440 [Streptomyces sp. NPDC026665]|uniref:hypothetical protein n=1 Tax=Streptomyces sp. NPDC026665 TaxID=3154798 RepID=UPI0033DF16A8